MVTQRKHMLNLSVIYHRLTYKQVNSIQGGGTLFPIIFYLKNLYLSCLYFSCHSLSCVHIKKYIANWSEPICIFVGKNKCSIQAQSKICSLDCSDRSFIINNSLRDKALFFDTFLGQIVIGSQHDQMSFKSL